LGILGEKNFARGFPQTTTTTTKNPNLSKWQRGRERTVQSSKNFVPYSFSLKKFVIKVLKPPCEKSGLWSSQSMQKMDILKFSSERRLSDFVSSM